MLTVSRDWINLFEGHFLTKTQVGHEAEVRTCELLCYAMDRLWHETVLRQFGLKTDKPTFLLQTMRWCCVLYFFHRNPECTCLFFFIMTSLHGSVLWNAALHKFTESIVSNTYFNWQVWSCLVKEMFVILVSFMPRFSQWYTRKPQYGFWRQETN